MRFFFFFAVLLAVNVLLVSLSGGAVVKSSDSIATSALVRSPPSANKYESHTTRFLRVDETSDNEERALPPVPSVSLFADWVKAMMLKVTDNARARYWLWRKQSAEDVFKQLKLDGGLDKLLTNRKVNIWATYVTLLNRKNPDKKVTMAGILTTNYGDLALSRTLELALNAKVKSQRRIAARLALQQREGWQAAGKSADDIFVLLKLDKAGDDLFVTPQLNSWYNYVSMVKKDDARAVMAAILKAHYGDEALAKIFREANPRVRRMRFVRVWLETAVAQSQPKMAPSPEKYFKALQLDAGVDKLLTNPNLDKWVAYVGKFDAKNPGQEATTIKTLTKFYGDEELAKALEAAKKVPQTEKMATELQAAQFKQWLKEFSPEDAFKLLKLDAGVDKLLTNPSLVTWITFLGQFNAKNPGKGPTMIKTFTKFYGDEALAKMLEAAKQVPQTKKVATQLQTAQFTQWMRDGKKHPEVWKMLKMEKATWTTNPDAQVWYGYKDFLKTHKAKVSGQ